MKTEIYNIPIFSLSDSEKDIAIEDSFRDYVVDSVSMFTNFDVCTGKYIRYLPRDDRTEYNLIEDWKTRVFIGEEEGDSLFVLVDSKRMFKGRWEKQLEKILKGLVNSAREEKILSEMVIVT